MSIDFEPFVSVEDAPPIGSRDKKRMNPFNNLRSIIRFYLLPNVVMGWESLSLPPTVT